MSLLSAAGLHSPKPLGRSMIARFRVRDWAALGCGMESQDQWRAWVHGRAPGPAAEPTRPVPSLLRRRVTPLGQMALRTALPLAQTGIRYVFCSRHGEFQRTLGLLESIVMREESSPAEFSLSVHNALAGLLSIATGNKAGHTAIAAGPDSFGFGLVEALGCLTERPDEPVLLVYFDEPLPTPYNELPDVRQEPGIALALLLEAPAFAPDDLVVSAEPCLDTDTQPQAATQALDFLTFLLGNRVAHETRGGRMTWRWARDV